MSDWTHVSGMIYVSPMGRTQAEKRYVLDTVLEHLPIVSGSEGDMDVYVIQPNGSCSSSSHDEFGCRTNNLVDWYGSKSYENGWLRTQDTYILVLNANLRDRVFDETYRELQKFLCRLAKRVRVKKVMVDVGGWSFSGYKKVLINNSESYDDMFERPSWSSANEDETPNWCEYLLWKEPPKCYWQ